MRRQASIRTTMNYLRFSTTNPCGRAIGQRGFDDAEAQWDLLRVSGRVLSSRRDAHAWMRYLEELGWPHRIPGLIRRPSTDHYA